MGAGMNERCADAGVGRSMLHSTGVWSVEVCHGVKQDDLRKATGMYCTHHK